MSRATTPDRSAADRPYSRPDAEPSAELIAEMVGLVPLLAAYFNRARTEMPEALQKRFTRHQLGARHGAVLTQLVAEQPLTVSGLAERLGVSLPSASELVGALDRAGLVTREPDPDNRRRTLVSLPEKHRRLMADYVTIRATPILRTLHRLPAEQREGFLSGLRIWASEVENGRR